MSTRLRIGTDLDNTVVCYEDIIRDFGRSAIGTLEEVDETKRGIRDFLRKEGRESEWTYFQGELYGPLMKDAKPYRNALKTLKEFRKHGHEVFVVSHRSNKPYGGQDYDLHGFARLWIDKNLVGSGVFTEEEVDKKVFLLESREDKIKKVRELEINVFVDDLRTVLMDPSFPERTKKFHFQGYSLPGEDDVKTVDSWDEVHAQITAAISE